MSKDMVITMSYVALGIFVIGSICFFGFSLTSNQEMKVLLANSAMGAWLASITMFSILPFVCMRQAGKVMEEYRRRVYEEKEVRK